MRDELLFAVPWWLLALPLAALPLWRGWSRHLTYSWVGLLPPDPLSTAMDWLLRAIAAVAVLALVLGLAGLQRPGFEVKRIGKGAEIVLLVDRSRSMDQTFISRLGADGYSNPSLRSYMLGRDSGRDGRPSKQQTARKLLAEFAAGRKADRFAMLLFSTQPIPVLDFTQKPDAVQAAIAAGQVGRGLSETDIGSALLRALELFRDRPFSGSRIVMLVSDGGDALTPEMRDLLTERLRQTRVRLYWIYIRSFRSPGLLGDAEAALRDPGTMPETVLHQYFRSVEVPYRAYEAEDPEALQAAIDDVARLETLPISYTDVVPPIDLSQWCYAVALAAVLLLLSASGMGRQAW